MDQLLEYIQNADIAYYLKICGVLLVGVLLASAFGRFVFGKRSILNTAVSSAIGILFLYAVTVVLISTGSVYADFTAPLPFVTLVGDKMLFFSFENVHYTVICAQLLNMVILAFLANLTDSWLPVGKNIFSWVFFRALTVCMAFGLHYFASMLINQYLPADFLTYAPSILLAILIVMLLTGALKIVIGALITTVDPLIAALYTFFFANFIGKMITKAVLTTLLLTGLVYVLNLLGCTELLISVNALTGYIPFAVALVFLWYLEIRVL